MVATVAAVAALLLSGAAAGAPQKASPKQWVHVFCGSVRTWEHTVKSSSAGFAKSAQSLEAGGKPDLRKLKARFVRFFEGLIRTTATMTGKVKGAGAPDVQNGDEIQAAVLGGFGRVAKILRDGRKVAAALPTNDAKAFRKRGVALGTSITNSSQGIGDAFSALGKYDTGALDAAASKEPACRQLGG
jgi:hypothetical protein